MEAQTISKTLLIQGHFYKKPKLTCLLAVHVSPPSFGLDYLTLEVRTALFEKGKLK